MRDRREAGISRAALGFSLTALGAALLVGHAFGLDFHVFWKLWPLWLVALGTLRLADRPRDGGGAWLVLIGLLLLADTLDVMDMHLSWPVFVIAGGVSLLLQELRRRRGEEAPYGQ